MKRAICELPNEIIDLVLSYYASRVEELLYFRTISRQWKQIGDNSLLWLTIDLSFYAPEKYYELNEIQSSVLNLEELEESTPLTLRARRKSKGDLAPYVISLINHLHQKELDTFNFIAKNAYAYKIQIIALPLTPIQRDPARRNPRPSSPTMKQTEKIDITRRVFLYTYSMYHTMWARHIYYRGRASALYRYVNTFLSLPHIVLQAYGATLFLLIVILFCFGDNLTINQDQGGGLSRRNEVGFFLTYCLLLVHCLVFGLLAFRTIYRKVQNSRNVLDLTIPWGAGTPCLVPAALCFSSCLSIIMFQNKCLHPQSTALTWAMTTIPMWIGYVLCFIVIYIFEVAYRLIKRSFIPKLVIRVALLIILPLFFTLLAVHFDQVNNHQHTSLSIQYAVIPLYPLLLVLVGVVGVVGPTLFNAVRSFRMFSDADELWQIILLVIELLSLLGIMSLLVHVIVLLMRSALSLVVGIRTFLIITICTLNIFYIAAAIH